MTPLRTVSHNRIISEATPRANVRVAPAFQYAGGLQFILYDIAHVEQHHFVVVDAEQRVQRQVWVQFEGYLENNSHVYNYPMKESVTLGGLTFLYNLGLLNIADDCAARPTSDRAHMVDYLRGLGITLQGDTMYMRLVWLDEALRNELMFIYSEDLAPTGYRLADLTSGGPAESAWSGLAQGLHVRAVGSISMD
jgi:hypothetical protein